MPRIMRKVVVFPAPIPAEKADDGLLGKGERHFVHDIAAVVDLDELCDFEQVHGRASLILRAIQHRTLLNKIKSGQKWITRGKRRKCR